MRRIRTRFHWKAKRAQSARGRSLARKRETRYEEEEEEEEEETRTARGFTSRLTRRRLVRYLLKLTRIILRPIHPFSLFFASSLDFQPSPPSPSHPLLFVSRLRNWTAAIPLDRIEPTASHDTGRDTGYNHRFRAGAIAWNEFYARLKLDCVDWHLNKNNAKGDAWFSIDACPISERQSGSLITEINGFPGKLTNSTFPLLQLMNECLTKTRLSLIRMNGLTFEATKCLGRWESNCRDNRVIYKRILNVGRIIYSNDDVSNSISSYLLASCYFKWLVSLFERKNGFSICRWCPAIWRNNFSFHFLFRTWIISSLFVILFE